jgi:hypothetical protein
MGSWSHERPWAAGLVILSLFAGGAPQVDATIITSGCADAGVACTLAELSGGASIIIDDKRFDDWVLNYDDSSTAVDLVPITVTPLDDQPLNPGLQFDTNGEFSVVGFDTIDVGFSFTVSTLDGSALIKDNSLEINGFTFGLNNVGGFITIFEDVYDATADLIGDKFVTADNELPVLDLFDSAQFAPQSQITVDTFIFLSGSDQDDTVSLDRFTQRFSQIPEPSGLLLLGIGLAGLGIYRKTQRLNAHSFVN